MLTLDFKADIAQALKKLNMLSDTELPKIVAHAMNKTMVTIRSREKRRIAEVFDRATPYAINAPFTIPATPQRLEVAMKMREFSGKGIPPSAFMPPEIYGGGRSLKGHEKALRAAGILPEGMYCVPAASAGSNGLLDQYGNLSGAFINRILSYLQANRDATQNRNKGGKAKAQQFFAVSSDNTRGLPLGIYQRVGSSFRLVIKFVKAPHYNKRFNYFEVADKTTNEFFIADLRAATDEAVAKASTLFSGADLSALLSI